MWGNNESREFSLLTKVRTA